MVLIGNDLRPLEKQLLMEQLKENASISDDRLIREIEEYCSKVTKENHSWVEALGAGCCGQWKAAIMFEKSRFSGCMLYHLLEELELRCCMYDLVYWSDRYRQMQQEIEQFLKWLISSGYLSNPWLDMPKNRANMAFMDGVHGLNRSIEAYYEAWKATGRRGMSLLFFIFSGLPRRSASLHSSQGQSDNTLFVIKTCGKRLDYF